MKKDLWFHFVLVDEGQEFQRAMREDAERAAQEAMKELGDGHTIKVTFAFAGGNAGDLGIKLSEAIHKVNFDDTDVLPDVVLVEPVRIDGTSRAFERIVEALVGLCVLNMSAELSEIRASHPSLPIFQVGNDQREVGRMQARLATRSLPNGGNILFILGREGAAAAKERREGFLSELEPHRGSINVFEKMGKWTVESGVEAAKNSKKFNSKRPIDLIVCQNDDMAQGVIESGVYPGIPVIGCDGMAKGKEMVDRGRMKATIVTHPTASAAIKALVAFWKHGAMPEPSILLTPAVYQR